MLARFQLLVTIGEGVVQILCEQNIQTRDTTLQTGMLWGDEVLT
jgi:hypothetical protein